MGMNNNCQSIRPSDQKISVKQSIFYGFQSILACNLFLGPIVIIAAMQMNVSAAAAIIAYTFFACGIATLVQSGIFLRYQVIQGMSFATLGAVITIGITQGFPTVFGAVMVASVVLIVVGYVKIFSKIVKFLIPGLVAGTVIAVIGIALMPITFNSLLMLPGNPAINFLEAGVTFVAMLILMRLGKMKSGVCRALSLGSVIYAIIIGTIVAACFGHVDLSPVKDAAWFAIPKVLPYGAPKFDISAILTMTIILVIVMIESVGTWFTVSELSGEELDTKRVDKGVVGEGLGCLIGTFFGGLPVTSYASNTGVIAVTRVFSRYAALAAGVIAIVMALCPKLMYLIAVVPGSVIWGIYAIIAMAVLMSGLSSIAQYPYTERNNMVFGISILATVGAGLLPMPLIQSMPPLIGYLMGSSICVGAIVAIIVNKVFPETEADRAVCTAKKEVEQEAA